MASSASRHLILLISHKEVIVHLRLVWCIIKSYCQLTTYALTDYDDSAKIISRDPKLPSQVDDNVYQQYVDAAMADAAGFCQISTTFFVAQGWDSRTMAATVSV